MEFCRIDAHFEVTGKRPTSWPDFGDIVSVDDTQFAADEASDEATYNLNEGFAGRPLNPGKRVPVFKVYQVTAGFLPAYVNYPQDTIDTGAMFRFAAR